jgi:uncharacterized protein (TIGR02266 family)
MGGEQRRRFPRKKAHVEFRGHDSEGAGELLFEGVELSAGGAFLRSDLLLEEGETFAVEFVLPEGQRPLRAQARVMWVRRFPREEEEAGMGIQFLAMSEEDQTALARTLSGTDEE